MKNRTDQASAMGTIAMIGDILAVLEKLIPAAEGIASLFSKHARGERLTAEELARVADIHAAVTTAVPIA
jgi:hypothetical protein